MKKYLVEATLRYPGYIPGGVHDGYSVELYAQSKKEAISKGRRKIQDMGLSKNDGPATYSASEIAAEL